MKRNPRKVRWTKAFRKAAGKEMTIARLFFLFHGNHLICQPGFDDRVREAQKCSCQIQQRVDRDNCEGNEESGRNQSAKRTCFLQAQVRFLPESRYSVHLNYYFQDGCCPREAQGTSQEGFGYRQVFRDATRTYSDRIHQGENSGIRQGQERTNTGRGSFHGHGYRLVVDYSGFSFVFILIKVSVMILCDMEYKCVCIERDFVQCAIIITAKCLSKFIFRLIVVSDIRVQGVVQSKQCFADSFACSNHRLQDSNRHSSNNRTNRTLDNPL